MPDHINHESPPLHHLFKHLSIPQIGSSVLLAYFIHDRPNRNLHLNFIRILPVHILPPSRISITYHKFFLKIKLHQIWHVLVSNEDYIAPIAPITPVRSPFWLILAVQEMDASIAPIARLNVYPR
ncbi:MAG: hypothetical protein ABII21_00705 [bacterium]